MHVAHREPEIALEMLEQRDVAPGTADTARLARRHLAEEGLVDGVGPVRDGGDLDHEARARRPHIARVLAERPLVLPNTGGHRPLDPYLGAGPDVQVVRLSAHP